MKTALFIAILVLMTASLFAVASPTPNVIQTQTEVALEAQTATVIAETATTIANNVVATQTAAASATNAVVATKTATFSVNANASATAGTNATATIIAIVNATQTATVSFAQTAVAQANATVNAAGTAFVATMNAQITNYQATKTAVASLKANMTATEVAYETSLLPAATQTAIVVLSYTPTTTPTNTVVPTATANVGKGSGFCPNVQITPATAENLKFYFYSSGYSMKSGLVELSAPANVTAPAIPAVGGFGDVTVTVNNVPVNNAYTSSQNIFVPIPTLGPNGFVTLNYIGMSQTAGSYTWTFGSCMNMETPTYAATISPAVVFNVASSTPTMTSTPTVNLTATTATPTATATATPFNNPINVTSAQILSTSPQTIKAVYITAGGTTVHYCNASLTANCYTNVIWTISAPGASLPTGMPFSIGVGVYQNTTYSSLSNVTTTVVNSY